MSDRPAVVFVHGWQGDRTVWRDVIAALGSDVRAVAVDLPGNGEASDAQGPYNIQRFSDAVRDVIESQGLAPAVVVGHSMGAKIALRLAVDAPQLVRGLILIGPVPAGDVGFSLKREAYLRATAGDPAKAKEWLSRYFAGEPNPQALEALCNAAARMSRDAALEAFESFAHADFAEATRCITAPVLIVATSQDPLDYCERKIASLLPNARCVNLPAEAHYVIVEKPDEIAKIVREFCTAFVLRQAQDDNA
jgi:pimeloyl-ACP methyl ester carboxylesterase